MQSFSIEYIFLAFYNAFTGNAFNVLPDAIHGYLSEIALVGLVVSLLLFIGIVYAHLRLEQIQADAKHRRHDAVDAYFGKQHVKNERWEHVKELMASASQADWRSAIVEADIMLFEMLKALDVPGNTIGEQLKSVNRTSFNTIDLAWEAHRIRNEIAHAGSAYVLTEREARRAIDMFRQSFEEFSYI